MNYDSSEIASSVHEDIAALKSTIRKISALQNNVQVLQEEFTERKGKKCSDSLIEKYINPEVEAAILAQSKSRLDEVLQVKNEIIQSTIESKKHLAVDKNCEKKMLLDTLGIGLNVVDIAKEVARVEFVIRSTKILVAFDMETKQFSLLKFEPNITPQCFEDMKLLLDQTNDLCGLLCAARTWSE